MTTPEFTRRLLEWYQHHGRKTLPWQSQQTPYRVWVSEIMLQQTQVNTVIPYFETFMQRFPTIADLANAPADDVLHCWTGLGYYTRARNLHKAAQQIMSNHQGTFPTDIEAVMKLPGIGRSTAGAILAFSQQQRHPILDGNVKRVLTRLYAIPGFPGTTKNEAKLWQLADELTPDTAVAEYTQAIMDLGATLCTRTKPNCAQCPAITLCQAYKTQTIERFPEKKPKKQLPTKERLFLIPIHGRQVLLHKRPDTGIWGGLWSFLEADTSQQETLRAYCKQAWGLSITNIDPLPTIKHTFSHYRLVATPILMPINDITADTPNNTQWFDLNTPFEIGLATPVKKLLTTLGSPT